MHGAAGLVCTRRGLYDVTLEVVSTDLQPPWDVQKLESRGWFGEHVWSKPLSEVSLTEVVDGDDSGLLRYYTTISCLKPETEYVFRIAQGSAEEHCECRTSGRPPVLEAPLCCARMPDALIVEWDTPCAEDDVPTLECQVQYRVDTIFTPTWTSVMVSSDGQHGIRWHAKLPDLEGATEYVFRVRARNGAGWSRDFSANGRGWTSDRPAEPKSLRQTARLPHAVTLECTVEDVEGAPALGVEADIAGAIQWFAAQDLTADVTEQPLSPGGGTSQRGIRGVVVSVPGLPETESIVRLWATNAVGRSERHSECLTVRPSERPKPVTDLKLSGRWVDTLEVEWSTKDPEGAPVTHCTVEYSGDASMLSSWEEVPAANISWTKSLKKSSRSTWTARVDGLERESGYLLRVFAHNEVGKSSDPPAPLNSMTACRPRAPHAMRALLCALSSIRLEFDVSHVKDLQKIEPMTQIKVEWAANLFWQEIPAEDIQWIRKDPPNELTLRNEVNIGNLSPGTWYSFRIWVGNEVGWNREIPPNIECHTATRPEKPTSLQACVKGLHTSLLHWQVADPSGAPVLKCEVEIRENSVFSTWRVPRGFETQSHSPFQWEQLVDGLRPSVEHLFRIRAKNDVDWSEWSTEQLCFATPATPTKIHLVGRRFCGSPAALDASEKDSCSRATLVMDFSVEDQTSTPTVLCVATARNSGRQVLGRRVKDKPMIWRVCFQGEAARESVFRIRAANAVGWSVPLEATMSLPAANITDVDELQDVRLTELVREIIGVDLRRREEEKCYIQKLQKKEKNKTAHSPEMQKEMTQQADGLAARLTEISLSLEALQSLRALGGLEDQSFITWPSRCQTCISELPAWSKQAAVHKDNLPKVIVAIKVLTEAGIWLERMKLEHIERLWSEVCEHIKGTPPESVRVFKVWEKQHTAWTDKFERQMITVWQEAISTAMRLSAAIGECGDMCVASERLRDHLVNLLALREAADQQWQKLRRLLELLQSVGSAENMAQSFGETSMMDKVSQTALGLLFTAVLPIPGTIEVGVVNLGMIWLESDLAGRHLVVDHPRSGGAEGPLERFRQNPKPRTENILQNWASGGCEDSVVVHNATARVLTVRLVDGEKTFMSSAYKKIQDAHPFMRIVTKTVEQGINLVKTDIEAPPVIVIEPTDAATLVLPAEALVPEEEATQTDRRTFEIEFAYGMGSHVERTVGRMPAKAGQAVSFVCLDQQVRIDNGAFQAVAAEFAGDSVGKLSVSNCTTNDAGGEAERVVGAIRIATLVDPATPDSSTSPATACGASPAVAACAAAAAAAFDGASALDGSASAASAAAAPAPAPDAAAAAAAAAAPAAPAVASASSAASAASAASPASAAAPAAARAPTEPAATSAEITDPDVASSSVAASNAVGSTERSTFVWDSDAAAAAGGGVACPSAEDLRNCVMVVNNDFAPVTLRFYPGSRMMGHFFETPLKEVTLPPGERQLQIIPRDPAKSKTTSDLRAALDAGDNSGDSTSTANASTVATSASSSSISVSASVDPSLSAAEANPPFEVEVVSAATKSLCNVRVGQILIYEGCL